MKDEPAKTTVSKSLRRKFSCTMNESGHVWLEVVYPDGPANDSFRADVRLSLSDADASLFEVGKEYWIDFSRVGAS